MITREASERGHSSWGGRDGGGQGACFVVLRPPTGPGFSAHPANIPGYSRCRWANAGVVRGARKPARERPSHAQRHAGTRLVAASFCTVPPSASRSIAPQGILRFCSSFPPGPRSLDSYRLAVSTEEPTLLGNARSRLYSLAPSSPDPSDEHPLGGGEEGRGKRKRRHVRFAFVEAGYPWLPSGERRWQSSPRFGVKAIVIG